MPDGGPVVHNVSNSSLTATEPASNVENVRIDLPAERAKVVKMIKATQSNSKNPYAKALNEIKQGHKHSHWIWYIWPCLSAVRSTTRREFELPDFDAALLLLKDDELRVRLSEITLVAAKHLEQGVDAVRLFGSPIDAEKFGEAATHFALAGIETQHTTIVEAFLRGLRAYEKVGRTLHMETVEYIAGECGYNHFSRIASSADIERFCEEKGFELRLTESSKNDLASIAAENSEIPSATTP